MRKPSNHKIKHYAITAALAVGFLLLSCIIGMQAAHASDWEVADNEGNITFTATSYFGDDTLGIGSDFRINSNTTDDGQIITTEYYSNYTNNLLVSITEYPGFGFQVEFYYEGGTIRSSYEFRDGICVTASRRDAAGRPAMEYIDSGPFAVDIQIEISYYTYVNDINNNLQSITTETYHVDGSEKTSHSTFYDNEANSIMQRDIIICKADGSILEIHSYYNDTASLLEVHIRTQEKDGWFYTKYLNFADSIAITTYFTDTGEEVTTEQDWKDRKYPGEENQEESNQEEESSTDPEEEQYAISTEENGGGEGDLVASAEQTTANTQASPAESQGDESQVASSNPEQVMDPYLAREMASQEAMYEQMSQEAETPVYPQEIPESQPLGAQVNM